MVNLTAVDTTPQHDFILPDKVMGTLKNLIQKVPDKPKHRIEYEVVAKTEDYEERRYPASTWVCTTVTGVYMDTAKIEGFRHLQTYAQGHNSAAAYLSMHPPILTRVSSDTGDGFNRKFVVSTYLCDDHHGDHPQPSSQHVYLEHLPEMTVFVRSFKGISCEESWTYETKRLAEVLRNKEDIRTDFYITATYESPFQLVSTRNEIWFLKFDRKEDFTQINKPTKMLKYGSQKVEIPNFFGWILQMLMVYLTFLMFIVRTSFSCVITAKDNWEPIKQRAQLVTKIMRQNVSLGGILRTTVSVFWMVWSLVLAVISGATTVPKDPRLYSKKKF